jgi:hypothetical protein
MSKPGMPAANRCGMDINTKVLSEVAFQLEKGNPLWGMALCNQYLPMNSPLRRAIALRFTQRLGHDQACSKIAQALIRASDRGSIQRHPELLGSRVVRTQRPLPAPRATHRRLTRLPARERSHQTPRYAFHQGACSSQQKSSLAHANYLSDARSR